MGAKRHLTKNTQRTNKPTPENQPKEKLNSINSKKSSNSKNPKNSQPKIRETKTDKIFTKERQFYELILLQNLLLNTNYY